MTLLGRVGSRRVALFIIIAGLAAILAARGEASVRPSSLAAPKLGGRLAYVVAGNIWIWQDGAHQLTRTAHDGSPVLSADGSQVTYVRFDDSFSDILVAPTNGGEPKFLTNNRPSAETGTKDYVDQALWALAPAWSPDGTRLAYASDRGTDAPVLWIMGAGGDNAHAVHTSPAAPPVEHIRWAPSGDALAATSMGSGKDEIWTLDLGSTTWKEVAAPPEGSYDPAWSPDGKRVAFAQRSGRQTDLFVAPADHSSPAVQLTHVGRARGPAFSPDGKQLAFLGEKDDRFQVFVVDLTEAKGVLQAGAPQQVTSAAEGVDAASGLSWSP